MGVGFSVVRQAYKWALSGSALQPTMFLRPYVGSEATFRVAFET
jgi:hypothetical protein